MFQLLEVGGQGLEVSIDDVVELLWGNRVKSNVSFKTDAMSVLSTTMKDILRVFKGKSPLQVWLYLFVLLNSFHAFAFDTISDFGVHSL